LTIQISRPMPTERPRNRGLSETDRLLHRIRTLIQRSGASNARNDASLRVQRREIDRLKLELADCVKRNPTGSNGTSRPSHLT
jgi:hypothetical protein